MKKSNTLIVNPLVKKVNSISRYIGLDTHWYFVSKLHTDISNPNKSPIQYKLHTITRSGLLVRRKENGDKKVSIIRTQKFRDKRDQEKVIPIGKGDVYYCVSKNKNKINQL